VGLFDAGEPDVEAAEGVGEAVVVDAEDVKHRGAPSRGGGPGFRQWCRINGASARCKKVLRRG
jgi:hypothetical protein